MPNGETLKTNELLDVIEHLNQGGQGQTNKKLFDLFKAKTAATTTTITKCLMSMIKASSQTEGASPYSACLIKPFCMEPQGGDICLCTI